MRNDSRGRRKRESILELPEWPTAVLDSNKAPGKHPRVGRRSSTALMELRGPPAGCMLTQAVHRPHCCMVRPKQLRGEERGAAGRKARSPASGVSLTLTHFTSRCPPEPQRGSICAMGVTPRTKSTRGCGITRSHEVTMQECSSPWPLTGTERPLRTSHPWAMSQLHHQ